MRKVLNVMTVLAVSAATATLSTAGAGATINAHTGRAAQGTCYAAGKFCGTNDAGGYVELRCGEVKSMPWSGGGYWNNRLPNNGRVRMANSDGWIIYTTPANYGPVRGNWTPVYSIRADC
ncbi:hypothetical protein ACWCPI_33570 [Streptomyces sp. NPDC001920]